MYIHVPAVGRHRIVKNVPRISTVRKIASITPNEHTEFSLNVISSDGWQTNETFPYITGDVFLSVEMIDVKKEFSLKKEALTEDLQDAIIETVSMASDLDCFESTLDHVLLQLYDNGMLRSSTYDTVIEMYYRTQADVDAHFEMHVVGECLQHFQPSTRVKC